MKIKLCVYNNIVYYNIEYENKNLVYPFIFLFLRIDI